jgi:hypothetical protein
MPRERYPAYPARPPALPASRELWTDGRAHPMTTPPAVTYPPAPFRQAGMRRGGHGQAMLHALRRAGHGQQRRTGHAQHMPLVSPARCH